MIKTSVTSSVAGLLVSLGLTGLSFGAGFMDGFEGTTLDSFWTATAGNPSAGYTPATYSLSTENPRSGNKSLKINYIVGWVPALYLGHTFQTPALGTYSVWYYDTLAPVCGGLYVDDQVAKAAALGRNYGFYSAYLDGYEVNVGSESLGWHHYEIIVTETGSSYRLDGVALGATSPLTAPLQLFLSSLIPDNNDNGTYTAYFDDFSFIPTPQPLALAGQVIPADYGDPQNLNYEDVGVRIDLRQEGSTVRTDRVFLDKYGFFTLQNVPEGTYDVVIKNDSRLRQVISNVVVNPAPAAGTYIGSVTLVSGDNDGNNEITSTDLAIMLKSMDLIGNQ